MIYSNDDPMTTEEISCGEKNENPNQLGFWKEEIQYDRF